MPQTVTPAPREHPSGMVSALAPGKDVEVFFDGDCPLCMREIRMLRRRDQAGRIQFTDIAAPTFDATALGTSQATLMARIHGRLADGTWIEGVEVFRRLYAAIGFRRIVAFTRLPIISHLLSLGYRVFAANRLRLTGRCTPDSCAIPAPRPDAT
jgi:predicted DCC family thiol-disulfide oxidoreductase YuxK